MSSQKRVLPSGSIVWENQYGFHRVDGPAIEWPNGFKEWWINGKSFSEAKFYAHLEKHHEEYGLVP